MNTLGLIEYIIEHIAKQSKINELDIRMLNLYKKNDITPYGQPLPYFNVDTIISDLKISSDYINRIKDIEAFNQANRWFKKGISLVPLKWGVTSLNLPVIAIVSILEYDGSVIIKHSGVEMGQGGSFLHITLFIFITGY